MSNSKIFKTLDEQVDILKEKGLVVNDVEYAKEVLLRENYFFINGYRSLFMINIKERKFIANTTFEELYEMFKFDRRIRNIMFKYLLIIENNIKSIFSYQLSKKYGIKEKDYMAYDNFNQDPIKIRQVRDVINKMKRQVRVNVKYHTATMHYVSNYGYIPFWVLVKVLSMGIIADLYAILKVEDQLEIARYYKLDIETVTIYLALISNFRNLCAHEDILYNHRTQRMIPSNNVHNYLNIEKNEGEYIYGKNDLFALVIIMCKMLTSREASDLINEIGYEVDVLGGAIKVIPLDNILNKIGFPSNWRDISKLL